MENEQINTCVECKELINLDAKKCKFCGSEQVKLADYEGYTKSLEKILDGVTKDYWASYIDINRHQVSVGKTYLWVSAALVGIYATAYKEFHVQLYGHSCFLVLAIIAFILGCLSFGICLYAIPARKGYKTIPSKGWGEFSHESYSYLKMGNEQVYATFLSSYISKIDNAFAYNFKTNQKRATLLRITSWLLIASFLVAIFLASSVSIEALINPKINTEVTFMSEDDNSNSSVSTEPSLQVPEPPPPADIGSDTVSTHSAETTSSRQTFITDSVNEKE